MQGVRSLVLTLALCMAAAGIGAWAGVRFLEPQRRAPTLHEFVHEELDLTADQESRLERLERDFAVRRKTREAQLRAANAELAAAIQARHEYSPDVTAAVERFHRAMGELQKETITHVLEMRKVLTPAQAARYDERIAEALTEESR
ncbi:MAG: periplasmic heavy metal sensor [Pseudomonadota bacterium]